MNSTPQTVSYTRGRLPHWQIVNGRYFVTIRLKGAIPGQGMERIAQLRRTVENAVEMKEIMTARRRTFLEMEEWLEAASRVDYLTRTDVADIVVDAIKHRQASGEWTMICYTLMPNHIHLFFRLGACIEEGSFDSGEHDHVLTTVLEGFKRRTARFAAPLLGIKGEDFWQREWFDHWSRGPQQDERIKRYIRLNAVKAGLVAQPEDWPFWRECE
jgi:REP element-mobilizing transposase RayT